MKGHTCNNKLTIAQMCSSNVTTLSLGSLMIYIRAINKAKSVFTLDVKDFSIKSHNTKLII